MCSFQVTLLQVNASFLVVNASATEASLRRLHHDGQGLRRPPSAQDPKAVGGLVIMPTGQKRTMAQGTLGCSEVLLQHGGGKGSGRGA